MPRISDKQNKLLEAIENNKLREVRKLLKEGADINGVGINFWGDESTPLVVAIGNHRIMEFLLNRGAKISPESIFDAISTDLYKSLEILIQHGAKINQKHPDRDTPLYWAAFCGSINCLRLLIKNGANTLVRDDEGNSLIYTALEYKGEVKVVEELVKAGLDVNEIRRKEFTHIYNAVAKEHPEELKPLTKDDPAMVKQLLKLGAKPDLVSPFHKNKTALHLAVSWRKPETAKILIEAGANVHHKDSKRESLPSIAYRLESRPLLQLLKSAGAYLLPEEELSQCIIEGNMRLMRELLKQTPKLSNTKLKDKQTPLHQAVTWGDAEAVEALLDAGAKMGQVNAEKVSPLELAVNLGSVGLVARMISSSKRLNLKQIKPRLIELAEATSHIEEGQELVNGLGNRRINIETKKVKSGANKKTRVVVSNNRWFSKRNRGRIIARVGNEHIIEFDVGIILREPKRICRNVTKDEYEFIRNNNEKLLDMKAKRLVRSFKIILKEDFEISSLSSGGHELDSGSATIAGLMDHGDYIRSMEILISCLERIAADWPVVKNKWDTQAIVNKLLGGMFLLTVRYRKPLKITNLRKILSQKTITRLTRLLDKLDKISRSINSSFDSIDYFKAAVSSLPMSFQGFFWRAYTYQIIPYP